jgi:hypothetical protein
MSTARPLPQIVLAFLAVVALAGLAAPARAGAVCSLQATVGGGSATEVEVGEEVLIEGFGFPPGDVEVSYSSDGTFLRSVTVTADAGGLFETTVIPLAGEEGLWSVEAVGVDEICTATTGFLVLASPTPSPSPTVAASTSTIPNVAVSTAPRAAPASGIVLVGAGLLLTAATSIALATARRRR